MARWAYSFMRSTQPSPIHTAWCLLLGRQGEQAANAFHTFACFRTARALSRLFLGRMLSMPVPEKVRKGYWVSIFKRIHTITIGRAIQVKKFVNWILEFGIWDFEFGIWDFAYFPKPTVQLSNSGRAQIEQPLGSRVNGEPPAPPVGLQY